MFNFIEYRPVNKIYVMEMLSWKLEIMQFNTLCIFRIYEFIILAFVINLFCHLIFILENYNICKVSWSYSSLTFPLHHAFSPSTFLTSKLISFIFIISKPILLCVISDATRHLVNHRTWITYHCPHSKGKWLSINPNSSPSKDFPARRVGFWDSSLFILKFQFAWPCVRNYSSCVMW